MGSNEASKMLSVQKFSLYHSELSTVFVITVQQQQTRLFCLEYLSLCFLEKIVLTHVFLLLFWKVIYIQIVKL